MKTVNFVESIWVAGGEKLAQTVVKHNQTAGGVYGIIGQITYGIGATIDVTARGTGSNGERTTLQSHIFPYDNADHYIALQDAIQQWIAQDGVQRIEFDLYL